MQTGARERERNDLQAEVTMYTTSWCGFCRRLKRALGYKGVDVAEIDIEENPEFGAVIEGLTGGYRTVPTIRVGDEYLVNPSPEEVLELVDA